MNEQDAYEQAEAALKSELEMVEIAIATLERATQELANKAAELQGGTMADSNPLFKTALGNVVSEVTDSAHESI